MRVLHTSDWHLGRSLHKVPLHDAQAAALAEIVRLTRDEAVDVVIIAGDVYDRAVPPVESVQLLERTLCELRETAQVVVTGGNHDSLIRLGYGSSLFAERLHVRTRPEDVAEPIIVRDDAGPVAIYAFPYLDPDVAGPVYDAPEAPVARSHQAVVGAACDLARRDLEDRRAEGPFRSIAVAHAFVVGAVASDSERDIRVGGVDSVTADVFEGFNYVALGHLHGPQRIGGHDHIRYSGSILRYSFSEADQGKSALLVDIDADGAVTTRACPLPQPRPMRRLVGTMAELLEPALVADAADAWVQASLTDERQPADYFGQLRAAYPHLLVARHTPASGRTFEVSASQMATALNPADQVCEFLTLVLGEAPTEAERALVATVCKEETR